MQVVREVVKMLKRLKEQEEARQEEDSDDNAEEDGSDQAVHDELDLEEGTQSFMGISGMCSFQHAMPVHFV